MQGETSKRIDIGRTQTAGERLRCEAVFGTVLPAVIRSGRSVLPVGWDALSQAEKRKIAASRAEDRLTAMQERGHGAVCGLFSEAAPMAAGEVLEEDLL